ncbi:hypothetical protein D3C81_1863350 [compost metagenome]
MGIIIAGLLVQSAEVLIERCFTIHQAHLLVEHGNRDKAPDLSCSGLQVPGYQAQQRGFTGTICATNDDTLRPDNLERDITNDRAVRHRPAGDIEHFQSHTPGW